MLSRGCGTIKPCCEEAMVSRSHAFERPCYCEVLLLCCLIVEESCCLEAALWKNFAAEEKLACGKHTFIPHSANHIYRYSDEASL